MSSAGMDRLYGLLSLPRSFAHALGRWVKVFGASVLVPLLSAILPLFLFYYVMEWGGGRALPSGLDDFLPSSWRHAVLMVLASVFSGILAFRGARKSRLVANLAAFAGVLTTAVLAAGMQVCDVSASLAAGGLAVLFVVGIAAAPKVFRPEVALPLRGLLRDARSITWSLPALVKALQVTVLLFMSFLVLVAFAYEELTHTGRPLLLLFAGLGITSVASVSPEFTFKNLMVLFGMVVSVVGSYMQFDRQVVDADYLMLAVAILVLGPATVFLFRTHRIVSVLTVPPIGGLIVMSFMLLISVLPAVFIGSGCGVSAQSWATVAVFLGMIAIACGVATCLALFWLLLGSGPSPE